MEEGGRGRAGVGDVLLNQDEGDFFFKAIFKMWLFDCLVWVVIYNPSCTGGSSA